MESYKRKERRISGQISIINEITRAVSSSLDIEDIFKIVAKEMSKIITFDRTSIVLIDEKNDSIYPHVLLTDMKSNLLAGVRGRLKGTAQELIVKNHRPIIEENMATGSFSENRALYREGLRSSIRVPLKLMGKIIGTINLDSRMVGHYSENDLIFLEPIASQIAISLENARLYREIKKTKDYFENIIQTSIDAIMTTDRRGYFNFVSQAARDFLGWEPDELVGRKHASELWDMRHDEIEEMVEELKSGARCKRFETGLISRSGTCVTVLLSVSMLRDHRGEFTGLLGMAKDITVIKKYKAELEEKAREIALINETLEQRVKEKTRELKETERRKMALTGMMAHNLKNPIVGIRKTMEMLMRLAQSEKVDTFQEVLQEVLLSCGLLTGMVDDILDVCRYEYHGLPLNSRFFDLSGAVEDAINLLKPQSREKLLNIKVDVNRNIHPLYSDRKKFIRVLINLLDNAINVSPPGGKVKIAAKMASGMIPGKTVCSPFPYLHLTVSDQGHGIPPDEIDRIFDLFYQVGDKENADRVGTGLGLSYCKMVVEAHGGEIWPENLKNRSGVKLNLLLPIKKEDQCKST